jgi:hypothetical protein
MNVLVLVVGCITVLRLVLGITLFKNLLSKNELPQMYRMNFKSKLYMSFPVFGGCSRPNLLTAMLYSPKYGFP